MGKLLQIRALQKIALPLIFLISFSFLLFLQSAPGFIDPDSFYHAKISLLMKQEGIVKDFPWLQMAVLKDSFTDHHFLYHLLLIPFLSFGLSPIWGVKLATAFFASLLIIFFFWLLKKLKIRWAFIWAMFLLLNAPFVFRLSLAKAGSLAILFLLIGLYALISKKHSLLFLVSFFYVWLHAGWPLMLIMAGIYSFFYDANILMHANDTNKERGSEGGCETGSARSLRAILVVILGLLLGLVINLFFPKNLSFYRYQIWEIAVKGYKKIIDVGAEWYPSNFFDLLSSNSLLFMIIIIALVLFIMSLRGVPPQAGRRNNPAHTLTLFTLMTMFFILTLRSSRNIEYFTPFAVLFSASAINPFLNKDTFKNFWQFLKQFFKKKKLLGVTLLIYLACLLPFIAIRDIYKTKKYLDGGFSTERFQKASSWLKENTPPKTIIFHTRWDSFPILFYHNSQNYYLVGLDPVFAYLKDKETYQAWKDLGEGKKTGEGFYNLFKQKFPDISYIFVEKEKDIAFNARLKWNENFEKVYEDEEALIYQLKFSFQ